MCCETKIVCCKYYSLVLPDQQYAGLPQWRLSLLLDLLPTLCWWQQAANQIWVGKWESAIFVFSLLLTSLMISSNITLNKPVHVIEKELRDQWYSIHNLYISQNQYWDLSSILFENWPITKQNFIDLKTILLHRIKLVYNYWIKTHHGY